MSNKMALDALTAALDAMEHMANTLNNMDAVDEDEDAQHDAAFEAVRAAIADREKANAAAMLSEILAEVERLAAQAAPTEPKHPLLNITAKQLRAALDFANPDPDDPDQLEAKVCIQWGEARDDGDGGTEPAGLRAWLAEYPEEGSISLDLWGTEEPPAAQPSQAPVVQAVPVNCGTGHCSCIECVVEPVAWVYWHPSDTTYDGPDTLHKKAVSRFTDDTRKAMMAKGWLFEPLYPASTAAQPLKAEQAKDAAEDAELLDRYGKIRGDLKASAYCVGNEYKPFHPGASHVRPEWRDGWNACYVAAIRAARAAERKA